MTTYHGKTFDPARDEERLNEQMVRVYRAMIDQQWHSLYEISAHTGDPVQSISARLRDLRKPAFGGFTVERRRRNGSDAVWEYRMLPGPVEAEVCAKAAAKRTGFLSGLIFAARLVAASENLAQAKASVRKALLEQIAKSGARVAKT